MPALCLATAPAAALPAPSTGSPVITVTTADRNTFLLDSDTTLGGETALAWVEQNATGAYAVKTRWHTPQTGLTFGQTIKSPAGFVPYLEVAVGEGGADPAAHLLWLDAGGSLWYHTFSPQGSAGPYLIRNGTVSLSIPPKMIAIDSYGAAAIWTEGSRGSAATWAAGLAAGGAAVGPDLLDDGAPYTTAVALVRGAQGGTTALWATTDDSNATLFRAEAPLGGNWSGPTAALTGLGVGCQHLAAGSDFYGNIHAVMDCYDSGSRSVKGAYAASGSVFGNTTTLGPVEEGLTGILVRENGAGEGVVVWDTFYSTPSAYLYTLHAAAFSSYGGFEQPVALVTDANDFLPAHDVALTPGGGALVFVGGTASAAQYVTFQYTRSAACSGWSTAQPAGFSIFDYGLVSLSLDATGSGWAVVSAEISAYWVWQAAPISYLEVPPLVVYQPTPYQTLEYPVVVVSGYTQPGAFVAVGSDSSAAQPTGVFVVTAPVSDGENTLTVRADMVQPWAGCSWTLDLTIYFTDPLVPLLADLAAAQARVDALNATLNSTRADLADSQALLLEAAAEIEALSLELNNTMAALDDVKVKFPWLEANATAAQANATLFKGELTALQADYDAAQARILLLEAQQDASDAVIQNATSQNAALAGQVAVLSIVAFASLIAAVGSLAVTLIQSKRGGGGGGSKLLAHEATHTVQQGAGKVEVRGWDPQKKEAIEGGGDSSGSSAKEFSPAEEQLKGNPRH